MGLKLLFDLFRTFNNFINLYFPVYSPPEEDYFYLDQKRIENLLQLKAAMDEALAFRRASRDPMANPKRVFFRDNVMAELQVRLLFILIILY